MAEVGLLLGSLLSVGMFSAGKLAQNRAKVVKDHITMQIELKAMLQMEIEKSVHIARMRCVLTHAYTLQRSQLDTVVVV